MAEIYGDKMSGETGTGDHRAKWLPLVISALIIVALIIAFALIRQ